MSQRRHEDETAATMALLWRSLEARPVLSPPGPKPRLDVDDIVTVAIGIADIDPVKGVSMRKVAEGLGITPMALYAYVPSKHALVSLMYDAIHSELGPRDEADGEWREQAAEWARDLLDLYVRHPWALKVSYARPVLGPHEQAVLESVVGVLRITNLAPGLLRRIVSMFFHVVRGTAGTIAEASQAIQRTGLSEREWWERSSAALTEVVPDFAHRFPNTVWVQSNAAEFGESQGDTYVERHARASLQVGLGVLFDGIESAMLATGDLAQPEADGR